MENTYEVLSVSELDEICYGERRVWKFAKTMAEHPHWYLLRNSENNNLFCRFASQIREHGYPDHFCWKHGSNRIPTCQCRTKVFIKMDYKDFTYWSLGDLSIPLSHPMLHKIGTGLINRSAIKIS